MAMERQDYPAMLPQLQPGQAVDILNDRVKQVGSLNMAIANWLSERRRLEEQYSSGLRKLARKQIEDSDLGIFSVPWTTLTGSADTLADSHAALATKMEVDVEQPLRSFTSTNREFQAMTTVQGNLASMAKDVERAQQKLDKLKAKGESGRTATADQELDHTRAQWESQAPYIFENLQAVDETRLNHLRDVLTQFQTHEVDMVQKNQSTAEHCLNVLLSLQTEDEIKTFALKAVSGRAKVERTQRPSASTPSRAPPASSSTLSPTMSNADNVSQRSGSVQEEKKKSRLGGLKRLGTVMGGRKNRESKLPSQLQPMAESPEPRSKASPFSSMGRLGRSKETSNLDTPQEATSPRNSQRPSAQTYGSEVFQPSSSSGFGPPSPVPRTTSTPRTNGASAAAGAAAAGGLAAGGLAAANIPNGSHQSDLADLEPPTQTTGELQAQQPKTEPVQDNEGYSLPPQHIDPITQAQQDAAAAGERAEPAYNVNIRSAPIREDGADPDAALAGAATKLQAPPPPIQSRVGTVRGRRQGRPTSAVPSAFTPPVEQPTPQSIPEQASEESQATGEPPSTSAAPAEEASRETPQPPTAPSASQPAAAPAVQSPSGGLGVGSAALGAGTAAAAATAFSTFPSGTGQSLPFRQDSLSAAGAGTGDNQSIRSGRSLTSTGSQGLRHPELTESGLNSSVVETISARFERGQIVSSSLIGEIAMAYNPTDFSSPFGNETIRLENFSSLEKVAPNPAFITQTPSREGEYSVNLANIAKTQVAFKYQLKADESGVHAPLLIIPAFRIEANQASIIVSYSLNPAFNTHGRESITLSNVTLGLTLEGAKATGCQSRPGGTFSRERNMIYWQLGDVTVKRGAAPEKLLARFATESEAKTGTIDTKWEIVGENAQTLGSGLAVSVQGQPSAAAGATDAADPFADDGATGLTAVWKGVQGVKKLTSGAYTAK